MVNIPQLYVLNADGGIQKKYLDLIFFLMWIVQYDWLKYVTSC